MMSVYFIRLKLQCCAAIPYIWNIPFGFVFYQNVQHIEHETLRRFDPKCHFKFSYVPEPVVNEAEEERTALT